MNWSGGKDSSLCLHYIMQDKRYSVDCLLTSVNAVHNRISMHGVRRELLEQQARAIGLPLETIELPEQPGMQEYENAMLEKVSQFKQVADRRNKIHNPMPYPLGCRYRRRFAEPHNGAPQFHL